MSLSPASQYPRITYDKQQCWMVCHFLLCLLCILQTRPVISYVIIVGVFQLGISFNLPVLRCIDVQHNNNVQAGSIVPPKSRLKQEQSYQFTLW